MRTAAVDLSSVAVLVGTLAVQLLRERRRRRVLACTRLGWYEEAHQNLDRSLELCRDDADLVGQARVHTYIDTLLERQERYAEALTHAERALDLYEAAGRRTDYTRARECYARALALYRELGSSHREADALDRLGDVHDVAGDPSAARAAWRAAVAILDALDLAEADKVRAKLTDPAGTASLR